jgi:hypothetical protein
MSWLINWPPVFSVLREATPAAAQEYCRQAEDRVKVLAGRDVVRDAAYVVGVLAAAGLVDLADWQQRLDSAGRASGHRNVARQVQAGIDAGVAAFERDGHSGPGATVLVSEARARRRLPSAGELLRVAERGQLDEVTVRQLVCQACDAVAAERNPTGGAEWLPAFRARSDAEHAAGRLIGALYACGAVQSYVAMVDQVVAASRRAGWRVTRESVERSVCFGIAAVWDELRATPGPAPERRGACAQLLKSHGWGVQ